jgi:hypothetical protein
MLLEQESGRKADSEFDAPPLLKMSVPQSNDPQEGARLVRAFLRIADPRVRSAIVHMVEEMGLGPLMVR